MSENTYHFIEVDNNIITAAKILILTYSELRTYDSIHLALALEFSELNPTVVTSDIILYKTANPKA